jgi:Zn-dependent protease with chaperone function
MATDFFQQQRAARRSTGRLVLYFALAVAALVALVYGLAAVLFLYSPDQPEGARTLWDPALLGGVALGVGAVVGLGSLFKTAQLAAGGKVVALTLGGRLVPGDTRDLRERRLLNVVEEMAIASGVPVPPVYVLPGEEGINAFAAGHAPGDAVVAVSEGCFTYLTRDELQGVVAHEFSHILNGDMRLNLRLLGLIYGILALSIIGKLLMQSAGRRSSSSQRDDRGRQGMLLFGIGLWLLGLVGAFFGRLIEAAVSRQREYLADASAVQFTRNPAGIAGALKKIGGLAAGSKVTSPHAAEAAHMFFADGLGKAFTGLLATHPPLADRIRRLDPQFDGSYPAVRPVAVSPEETRGPQPGRVPPLFPGAKGAALPVLGLAGEGAAYHVAHVTPREVAYAEGLQAAIPDALGRAARDPFGARALVYCLLLDPRPDVRQAQLAHLERSADPRDYALTRRLAGDVGALPDAARLPLLDLTLSALRQMSPRQHAAFRAEVDALIAADRRVSVFEYALRCVLARHLDDGFRAPRPAPRPAPAGQLAGQTAVVLSLLAREGHADEEAARAAFDAGMRAYGDPGRALLPPEECQLPAFDAALRLLGRAPPEVKRRVVVACAACIVADEQVTVREGELLRAICDVLGCPMPPLTAGDGADGGARPEVRAEG